MPYLNFLKPWLWFTSVKASIPLSGQPSLLKQQPKDIQNIIYSQLDTKSLAFFSTTCIQAKQHTEITRLLQCAIYGQENSVKLMLDHAERSKDPNVLLKLLTTKGKIKDYSGRVIYGTVFQLALGADDAAMCEMILPYFKLLKNDVGKVEIIKQYEEQFPRGWDEKRKVKQKEDLIALRKVVEAIINSIPAEDSYEACEKACEGAILEFKEYLKKSQTSGRITSGNHFNIELLVAAFKWFGCFTSLNKKQVYCRKIISPIEQFLPVSYAQAFCYGVKPRMAKSFFWGNYLVSAMKINSRSLKFYSQDFSFYPLIDKDFVATTHGKVELFDSTNACPLVSDLDSASLNELVKNRRERILNLMLGRQQYGLLERFSYY